MRTSHRIEFQISMTVDPNSILCVHVFMYVCMYVCHVPSHGDDPSWFRHLVIDLPKSGSHLIGQCSRHNHHIGLTLKQGRPIAD